ncbi:MAG: putative DNA-binding domain-containing protein [Methylocella sp.]
MNLASLQNAFQAGILGGDPVIPPSIEDGPRQDRAARFRVYYDAYRFRLAECLSNEYSALRDRLGDADFGALIEAYIETQPSRHPAAQDYCRGLPDFMRATAPWRERRDIVDFAAFERQLSIAFDAADASTLAIASLAHVAPADWPGLTFAFHPSVTTLDLLQGTAQAYARTRGHEDAEGAHQMLAADCETILFWRNDGGVFYRAIDAGEKLAQAEAAGRSNFAQLCAALAERSAGADVTAQAAGFLARWFNDGLVAQVGVNAAAD